MKKLIYISGEDFFDVDFPVLKGLNEHFNLLWIPILRVNSWYSLADIERFSKVSGVKVKPLTQKYKYKDPRMVLFYVKLLAQIKAEKPDIIYFEYFGVPLLHLLTPFYFNMKKIVLAIHDVKLHHGTDYGMIKTLYFQYIMNCFLNFHIFSNAQHEIFRKKYQNKNVLIANLCLKDFGKPTVIRNKKNKKINFLFFGIIRNNKGVEILIDAFNQLAMYNDRINVTISGFTNNWRKYDKLINNKSIYNLDIRKIPNTEIPNIMASADYILLPYLDVTQSGVLLTAYNYNLPAIASDFEGFREYIINGYNGYLIEPNTNKLKECIENILKEDKSHNREIRGNLGAFVDKYINSQVIIREYVKYFNQM